MGITFGFGTMMDLERGISRAWYMRADGVKRWADNDKPVASEKAKPDCRACTHCPTDWRDFSQAPICEHPAADKSYDKNLGRVRGNWALYSLEKNKHCGPERAHFENAAVLFKAPNA